MCCWQDAALTALAVEWRLSGPGTWPWDAKKSGALLAALRDALPSSPPLAMLVVGAQAAPSSRAQRRLLQQAPALANVSCDARRPPHAEQVDWLLARQTTHRSQGMHTRQVTAADVTMQLGTGSAADVPSIGSELQRIASNGALLVCPSAEW